MSTDTYLIILQPPGEVDRIALGTGAPDPDEALAFLQTVRNSKVVRVRKRESKDCDSWTKDNWTKAPPAETPPPPPQPESPPWQFIAMFFVLPLPAIILVELVKWGIS